MVAAAVGGRVISTSNASEAYVGYCTKYGDTGADYAVLREYTVREVLEIGRELRWNDNVFMFPTDLIMKTPEDGMSGKTDEENLGFTYQQLDAYLLDGICPPVDVLKKIKDRHNANQHKYINLPRPYPKTRHHLYSL